jgi:hypothetical protein
MSKIKNISGVLANAFLTAVIVSQIFAPRMASASETSGTIDASNKSAKICYDATCTTFGIVNFKPTLNASTSGAIAVNITDTAIVGSLWGDAIGWVNLTPSGLSAGDVLKVNPATGVITGKAFSSVGSWVNFSPTQPSTGPTVGVTINPAGEFTGWAWVSGANGGWMKFDCASPATCVKTDWRIISARTVVTPPNNGGPVGMPQLPGVTPTPSPTPAPTPTPSPTPDSNPNPAPTPDSNTAPSTNPNADNDGDGVKNSNDPAPNNPSIPNGTSPQPTQEQIDDLGTPTGSGTGTTNQGGNGFDNNNDGIPDVAPGQVPNDGGLYKQVFPFWKTDFIPERDCYFCVIVKKDIDPTKNDLIKYGFVPTDWEIPVPMPLSIPDVDATSISLTAVALYGLRWVLAGLKRYMELRA